ncbi:MAG: FliM/FliN family flagellar motor switch protein [Sandaracinaceae bacterium]|jgi:type III secretion protein Q|nr:FliM/FliN family flagellar motor switch protein [Sandaracinaceae bacterium]
MSTSSHSESSLPRWTDGHVALARNAQRLMRADVASHIAEESRELLGLPLAIERALASIVDDNARNAWPKQTHVAALLATPHGNLVLDVDRFLAACIIDRVLGGEGGKTAQFSTDNLSEVERGLFAYFVARLVARAGSGVVQLVDVITSHEQMMAALGAGECAVWNVPATVGADRGPIRVIATKELLARAPVASASNDFSTVPVECIATVGRALLSVSEISSLEIGDSIVLDDASFEHAWVYASHPKELSWKCKLEEGSLRIVSAHAGGGMKVTEGKTNEPDNEPATAVDVSLRHVQDVHVELSAELARFTLPYVELTTLSAGDVLRTGRPITDQIVLRIGRRTIANAELVDIDGELGVRIVQLLER